MDALQAALLRVKLPHVPAFLERRKENARRYLETFESASVDRTRLTLPTGCAPDHTYNQFVIRSPERDALRTHLRAQKIDCPIYYPSPLHRQPAMQSLVGHLVFPHAERAARESLALPVYPALKAHHIDRIAAAVIDFFG
jgi:dTDP-4-amino-4,6-dideoxygalactose transaminase